MKSSCLPFRALFLMVVGCCLALARRDARANAIINGDFATGDLTGWTASAIDFSGNPVPPLIDVLDLGGLNSAVFSTGTFADGPFISTLQQTFTVLAGEPILSFDFSLPELTIDPTGSGLSPFSDSMVVSVQDFVSRELLLVIKTGALPDPFGTAPGPIAIGPASSPLLQYSLQADLSTLAGREVTLFFDVINEDDGFISVFDPTKGKTGPKVVKPIPDAAPTLVLFLIALCALHPFRVFASRRAIQ